MNRRVCSVLSMTTRIAGIADVARHVVLGAILDGNELTLRRAGRSVESALSNRIRHTRPPLLLIIGMDAVVGEIGSPTTHRIGAFW